MATANKDNKPWYKKICTAICAFSLAIAMLILISFSYMELAGDFRFENIVFDEYQFQPLEQTNHHSSLSDKEPEQILNQPFAFLGKGHQAFVFESQDGNYVIKFFRFWRLKPSCLIRYLSYIPLSYVKEWCDHYEKKRLRRLEKLFSGYQVAYAYDQKNSGLIYLHLKNSNSWKKQIVVTDRYGFENAIQLDEVFFAIQKKGVSTKETLTKLLDQGDTKKTKQLLRSLLDLYMDGYKRGIIDQDHNLLDNTGFSEGIALRLDIGQLQKDDNMKQPEYYLKDLRKIIDKRLARWLRKKYPQYVEELMQDLEKKFHEISL